MEKFAVIAPAVIALIGTIITAVIAYKQWKRKRLDSHSEYFLNEQRTSYKALWTKLQDIELFMRSYLGDFETDEIPFEDFIRDVNAYILRNALFLDQKEQKLINSYLRSSRDAAEAIHRFNDPFVQDQWRWTVGELFARQSEVQPFLDEMQKNREQIIERFRTRLKDTIV